MNSDVKTKGIVLLVVLVAGILLLLPTLAPDTFGKQWISQPIKLGLDLRGGVNLVYRVESDEAVKGRLQTMAQVLKSDLKKDKVHLRRAGVNPNGQLELTLLTDASMEKVKEKVGQTFKNLSFVENTLVEGRTVLRYSISSAEVERIKRESIDQAIETLRNRVDQYGVAEPLVQKLGAERINLQMPGETNVDSVKKLVGSVAKLEFRFLPSGDTTSETITLKDKESGGPITVEEELQMTGDAVDDARMQLLGGQVEVSLTLNSAGSEIFRKITAANVGRRLAIILDGEVYSSPVIREQIAGGQASISGGFSIEEAKRLAVVLRAGALPAPLVVLEERTVGPSLGAESISQALTALAAGIICVALFMMVYYKKSGGLALACLLINLLLTMAVLAAFNFTLTLPGLVGLALTVGMAVDANVLIFERIREELNIGATRDAAVEAGFHKAWSAIVDSNVTSLLLAAVLFAIGTGPIRGFAVTLAVGIFGTLFTATFVAKLLFDIFPLSSRVKALSV